MSGTRWTKLVQMLVYIMKKLFNMICAIYLYKLLSFRPLFNLLENPVSSVFG